MSGLADGFMIKSSIKSIKRFSWNEKEKYDMWETQAAGAFHKYAVLFQTSPPTVESTMRVHGVSRLEAMQIVDKALQQRECLDSAFWNDLIPYVELESFPFSKRRRIMSLAKEFKKSGANLWFMIADMCDRSEGAEQDAVRDILRTEIKTNPNVDEVVKFTEKWWEAWLLDTRSDLSRPSTGVQELLRLVCKNVHGKMGNFLAAQLSHVKMHPKSIEDGSQWVERLHEALREEKSVFDSDVGAGGFVVGGPGGPGKNRKTSRVNTCTKCKVWGCTEKPNCVIIDSTIPIGKDTPFSRSSFYITEGRKALAANPSLNLKEWRCPPNPNARKKPAGVAVMGASENEEDEKAIDDLAGTAEQALLEYETNSTVPLASNFVFAVGDENFFGESPQTRAVDDQISEQLDASTDQLMEARKSFVEQVDVPKPSYKQVVVGATFPILESIADEEEDAEDDEDDESEQGPRAPQPGGRADQVH